MMLGGTVPIRWYVRHVVTGEIQGPMAQDEAEGRCTGEWVMFSDELFNPTFVISEQVQRIIRDLREMESSKEVSVVAAICQEAAEALTILSREKLVTGTVEAGIFDVDELPAGVRLVVNDYDIEGCDGEDLVKDVAGRQCFRREFVERQVRANG